MSRTRNEHRSRPRAARRQGFTLIEVLASLMLMVVVLPVVMGGLSMATRAGSLAKSRDQAIALAEAQLTEIVAERAWTRAAQGQRAAFDTGVGPDAERFTWTLDVRNWRDASLRELTLTVHWHQHGREHAQRLSTVVPAEEASP